MDKSQAKLESAERELLAREQSQGTYHDLRRMQKLRDTIAALKRRIARTSVSTAANRLESRKRN